MARYSAEAPGDPHLVLRSRVTGGVADLELLLAVGLVFFLGSRVTVLGLPVALLLAGAVLPVWWGVARKVPFLPQILALGVLAVVCGCVAALLRPAPRGLVVRDLIAQSTLVLTVVIGAALIVWLRELRSAPFAALVFGLGSFLAIRPNPGVLEDPWRFGFAVPVIIVVLAWGSGRRRPALEVGAAVVLLVVMAASGARSRTGVILVVTLLLLVQAWGAPRRGGAAVVRVLVLIAGGGLATYQLGQAVILEGYLGVAAQERSAAQIDQSGSLLVGGRPELGATSALFQHFPLGFGAGVTPTMHDVAVAKSGMRSIGYSPDNGYVEGYMFGHGVEVHSVIGDLWARHSLGGLVFIAAALAVLFVGMARQVAGRTASSVALFAGCSAVWDAGFSPMLTSAPLLTLAIGLLLANPAPTRPPSVDVQVRATSGGDRSPARVLSAEAARPISRSTSSTVRTTAASTLASS